MCSLIVCCGILVMSLIKFVNGFYVFIAYRHPPTFGPTTTWMPFSTWRPWQQVWSTWRPYQIWSTWNPFGQYNLPTRSPYDHPVSLSVQQSRSLVFVITMLGFLAIIGLFLFHKKRLCKSEILILSFLLLLLVCLLLMLLMMLF